MVVASLPCIPEAVVSALDDEHKSAVYALKRLGRRRTFTACPPIVLDGPLPELSYGVGISRGGPQRLRNGRPLPAAALSDVAPT